MCCFKSDIELCNCEYKRVTPGIVIQEKQQLEPFFIVHS